MGELTRRLLWTLLLAPLSGVVVYFTRKILERWGILDPAAAYLGGWLKVSISPAMIWNGAGLIAGLALYGAALYLIWHQRRSGITAPMSFGMLLMTVGAIAFVIGAVLHFSNKPEDSDPVAAAVSVRLSQKQKEILATELKKRDWQPSKVRVLFYSIGTEGKQYAADLAEALSWAGWNGKKEVSDDEDHDFHGLKLTIADINTRPPGANIIASALTAARIDFEWLATPGILEGEVILWAYPPPIGGQVELLPQEPSLQASQENTRRESIISKLRSKFPDRIIADVTPEFLMDQFKDKMTIEGNRAIAPYVGRWHLLSGQLSDVSKRQDHGFAMITLARENDGRSVVMDFYDESIEHLSVMRPNQAVLALCELKSANGLLVVFDPCELLEQNLG